jgi:hypothetical protein
VFPIRIGFSADPDPSFYLNVDPDPGRTLSSQKVGFDMKNVPVLYLGFISLNILI